MAALVSREEVGKELIDKFKGTVTPIAENQYFDDFTAIGSLLTDMQVVTAALTELELSMRSRVTPMAGLEGSDDDVRIASAEFYFSRQPGDTDVVPQKHLLRDALRELETRYGFTSQVPRPRILTRELNPKEFRGMIRSATHWKDSGVLWQHGEYTHRIQWYVIIHSNRVANPALVFAETANVVDPMFVTPRDVWQALVDREKSGSGATFTVTLATDFRCPENLNLWLINEAEGFPVLKAALTARATKRRDNPLNNRDAMIAYLERKVGTDTPTLSPTNAAKRASEIYDAGWYNRS
jgi:hypothetical protein